MNLDSPNHAADDRRRRESGGSGDSSAPTVEEGNDSSEAETVILPEPERRPPRRNKHHSIKRLQRRIPSSSSSDEDGDGRIYRRRPHAPLKKRKPSAAKSSRSASPAHQGGRRAGRPIRDPSGRLALQKMCDRGDYSKARQLIEAGADVNDRDYAGNTAIHDAALKGHVEIVELLLDHGAIIDIRSGVDELDTPLIDAAATSQVAVVKLLLDRGADPRIYNKQGKTALDSIPEDSAEYDELERMLKEAAYRFRKARRGSEASTSDNASRSNNDIDQATNFDPSNSIPGTFPPELTRKKHEPQESSRSSAAPRRRGARSQSIRNDLLWMDLTTRSGREQVYKKAADGDIQYVGKSLEEGWVPDGQSIGLAAKHGHTDLVGLLLAFGGNSDALNFDGETAMEQTIGRGHLDTIKLLLKSGADPLRKDKRGRSYYDIARDSVGSDDEETLLIQDAMESAMNDKSNQSRSHNQPRSRNQSRSREEEPRSDRKRKIKRESPNGFKDQDRPDHQAKKKKPSEDREDKREDKELEREHRAREKRHAEEQKLQALEKEKEERRKLEALEKEERRKLEALEKEERRKLEALEKEERRKLEALEKEKEERRKLEALEKEKEERRRLEEEEERKKREAIQKEKERKEREVLEARKEKERRQREALEAQREKERKQREALEAQKEKERRQRELEMLKSLEADEKRKQEARRRAEEEEAERQHQIQLEAEKRKEFEEERQRALSLKKDAEHRKKFPYGVRIAHFGPGHTIEHMHSFLPLLVRSFDTTAKLPSQNTSDLSQFYFVDLQISLFLGVQNLYQAYPDLTKKLVTDQEKNRMWTMLVPWLCRRVHPFDEAPPPTADLLAERLEDKKRFCAMTVFWLKVEQVVDILRRDFAQAYQLFNTAQLVHMDLDYDENSGAAANGASVYSHLPSRMRVKMEYPTWQ